MHRHIFAIAVTGLAIAFAPPVLPQVQTNSEGAGLTDFASLKAAAEAIDPLAEAAKSEGAWSAYLEALEAQDGPAEEQARALNRIGDSRYYQQKMAGALASSLEAERRLVAAGATGGEIMAETLSNMAAFYTGVGKPEKDVPLQQRSLQIRNALYGYDPERIPPADAKPLGLGYLNYAVALYEAGRFGEAAKYVDPAIKGLVRGGMTDSTLFVALSSGANIFIDAGRQVDALRLARQGVAKANELLPADHPFHGFAQATLAKVLLQAGRYEEAEQPGRNALDIMTERLGPTHRHTLVALHNLGVVQMRLGQYDEAIALMLARHERLTEIDPGEAVNSLLSASNAALEAGRDDEAMQLALKGASLARKLPAQDEKALRGLLTLALRYFENGETDAALGVIEEIETRASITGIEPSIDVAVLQGLSQIRAGQAGGWEMVAKARAQIVDRMIADASSFELGADLENFYEPIMQIAEAAIVSGRADDALDAFELASWGVNARARQLARLRHSQFDRPDLAADIERLRTGTARLRLLARERAAMLAAGRSEAIGEVEREIADLKRSVSDAEAALRTALPEFDTTRRPVDVSIETVQARLGPDEALLIAMPAKRGLLLMAVTPETVVMKAGLGGRPTIRPLVERLRLALDAGEGADTFPFDDAKTLHDLVLPADIAAALNGKDRVSLVTSDALSRLPFSALLSSVPDRQVRDFGKMDWLVRHHAFATVLSPSAVLGSQHDGGKAGRFLGIGDPGNSDEAFTGETRAALATGEDLRSLPSLPASREEVRLAGEVSGASERIVLIGDDATEARLRLLAGTEYSVVLFATHGLMEGELGGLREPALVLTPGSGTGGATDDGILHAGEIAELGLSTQIAILSACNTAAGRSHAAPAYTGLANAFLASGSERVMLSHWRVQDEAASQLTVEFVKRLRDGHAHADALRLAQLSMLEDETDSGSANPARWASMVLIDGR
ncbi:CHAT domain-containing protein [Qipengyuania flava]|uniref:CHAT domain-containing tetratricopeptide repeat protein n=1 Tax=Qipengyuania flava TaxID=192812 RepID=UPI003BB20530